MRDGGVSVSDLYPRLLAGDDSAWKPFDLAAARQLLSWLRKCSPIRLASWEMSDVAHDSIVDVLLRDPPAAEWGHAWALIKRVAYYRVLKRYRKGRDSLSLSLS